MKDHWKMVVLQEVGTFLVPARKIARDWKVQCSGGSGIGTHALSNCHLASGPVYPGDFGVPYVLLQTAAGIKRLYTEADDMGEMIRC